MPQVLPCMYCGVTFNNSFKLHRHCLEHLPWFFGSILCCICEQRFGSKRRLEDHCETKGHKTLVEKVNVTLPDVEQLRLTYCKLEGSSSGSEFQDFLCNYCVPKKTYTNFERSDGILDRNLFPQPPRKMHTPVQDDNGIDMGRYQGMLPTSFPLMSTQVTTVLVEEQTGNPVGEVQGQLDSHEESVEPGSNVLPGPGDANPAQSSVMPSTSMSGLEDIPDPPRPAKRPRLQSTPGPQHEDKFGQVLAKLQTLEAKVEGLNKKVVETAEHQAADIKIKLAKLGDSIESNTACIQDYSKSLAVVLQKDLAKLFDTMQQLKDNPNGPQMSPAMMSALLTLAQEAMKMYGRPYQPGELNK